MVTQPQWSPRPRTQLVNQQEPPTGLGLTPRGGSGHLAVETGLGVCSLVCIDIALLPDV